MTLETIRGKVELGPQKWQICSHQVVLSRSHVSVALDEQAQVDLEMTPFGLTELKDVILEDALEAHRPQHYIDLHTSESYPSEFEDFVDYPDQCHRFA